MFNSSHFSKEVINSYTNFSNFVPSLGLLLMLSMYILDLIGHLLPIELRIRALKLQSLG